MLKTIVTAAAIAGLLTGNAVMAVDGKAIYDTYCMACHAMGVAGAPKYGDAEAWSARIAQGKETLYEHSLNGYQGDAGIMPAKGGFTNLSDEEVTAAVDHMVSTAGGE
jgi:cytochrome c5